MKIGITYLYTISRYGYPPRVEDDFRALAEIEKMGFHYLEMEGLGREHTEQVWRRRADLRSCLDDHGIQVHNFCAVDPDMVSMNRIRRKAAYERFQRTAELGVYLGARTLHLASYAPPVEYLGEAPYQLGKPYSFRGSFRIRIPRGFDWQKVWEALVESCRRAAEIAAEHTRTVIIEPRVGEIICSPDSLLRLIHDVSMQNFKANFDTAHFSAQRENVPLALMKLEKMYANIHLADNVPTNTRHLPLGDGTIDWNEVFRILKMHHYDGYLGLDLGGSPSLAHDLKRSLAFIKKIAVAAGIRVES